jgi:hypothetical protein
LPRDGPWIAAGVTLVEQLQWAQAQAHDSALEAAFCAWGLGFVWMSRGMRSDREHLGAAVDALRQSLQRYRCAGGHPWEVQVLEHLGHCYRALCRYDEAITALAESRQRRSAAGDRFGVMTCSRELGFAAYLQGDSAGAERAWSEAFAIAQAIGDRYGQMDSRFFLSVLALTQGDWARAQPMVAEVAALAEQLQSGLYRTWSARSLAVIAAMQQTAQRPEYRFLCTHGPYTAQLFFVLYGAAQRDNLERSLAIAATPGEQQVLLPLAANFLLVRAGNAHAAAQLLGSSELLGLTNEHWLRQLPEIADLPARLVRVLGQEGFGAASTAGRALPLANAVALAQRLITQASEVPHE